MQLSLFIRRVSIGYALSHCHCSKCTAGRFTLFGLDSTESCVEEEILSFLFCTTRGCQQLEAEKVLRYCLIRRITFIYVCSMTCWKIF